MVLSHRGAACKCEHAGAGVPAAGNAVLVREGQCVFARYEAGGDRHGRSDQVRTVDIAQRHATVDDGRGGVLDVGERRARGRDHRRVIHRRVADSRCQHIGIDGAVIDLDTEARRDLIPIIHKLHQAAAQISTGESGDGCAGRTAQLEEATRHPAHRVGKASVVWIGDAEVGRRERDGLAFADGERGAGHHRRIVDRCIADSRGRHVGIDGAVVDLDTEAWRNFVRIIDKLHQAATQVSAGESGDGCAGRTA